MFSKGVPHTFRQILYISNLRVHVGYMLFQYVAMISVGIMILFIAAVGGFLRTSTAAVLVVVLFLVGSFGGILLFVRAEHSWGWVGEERKEHLMKYVSDVRELEFREHVDIRTASRDSMMEELLRGWEAPQRGEKRTLRAFGLLEGEESVAEVRERWVRNVPGGYFPKSNRIVLIEGKDSNDVENHEIVHELTHALQNQQLGLSSLGTLKTRHENNRDLSLAIEALCEGDASYVEYRYLAEGDDSGAPYDESGLHRFLNPTHDNFSFLIKCQDFPYAGGLLFVERGWEEGWGEWEEGWKRLNEAYENPPVSTEQILHPEKYFGYFGDRDRPTQLHLPDVGGLLGSEWEILDNNNFGEYATGLLLLKHLSGSEEWENNIRARNGWDGDSYLSYSTSGLEHDTVALVWLTMWDTEDNAVQFQTRYEKVLDEKYPDAKEVSETENLLLLEVGFNRCLVERRGREVLVLEEIPAGKLEEVREEVWKNRHWTHFPKEKRTSG